MSSSALDPRTYALIGPDPEVGKEVGPTQSGESNIREVVSATAIGSGVLKRVILKSVLPLVVLSAVAMGVLTCFAKQTTSSPTPTPNDDSKGFYEVSQAMGGLVEGKIKIEVADCEKFVADCKVSLVIRKTIAAIISESVAIVGVSQPMTCTGKTVQPSYTINTPTDKKRDALAKQISQTGTVDASKNLQKALTDAGVTYDTKVTDVTATASDALFKMGVL